MTRALSRAILFWLFFLTPEEIHAKIPFRHSLVFAAASQAAPAGGNIRCGKLLDVRSGKLLEDQLLSFDADGNITSVAKVGAPVPPGTIDLSRATCLPGLMDVHTHITSDPTGNGYAGLGISVPREAVTGVKNARLTLLAGFTTVRNVGASSFTDVAVRDGINAGEIVGPRMFVSGPPLGITGGHCDDNLLPFEYHHVSEGVADGPWAARAKVREVIKYGADVIKICASGGVLSKGDQPGASHYTLEESRRSRSRHAIHQGRHPSWHRFHRAFQPDRR